MIDKVKERNLWKDIFGITAFTVQMIPPKAEDEMKG